VCVYTHKYTVAVTDSGISVQQDAGPPHAACEQVDWCIAGQSVCQAAGGSRLEEKYRKRRQERLLKQEIIVLIVVIIMLLYVRPSVADTLRVCVCSCYRICNVVVDGSRSPL
jgi:predicted nucleic acid-binding Zn ribbon protein